MTCQDKTSNHEFMLDIMCNVCFKGWLKSFTRTEILLTLLEAVLLTIFIGLFVFLILHFLACSKRSSKNEKITDNINTTEFTPTDQGTTFTTSFKMTVESILKSFKTEPTKPRTPSTIKQRVKCTWKESQKTEAYTHYYYPVTKIEMTKITSVYDFYDNKTMIDNSKDTKVDIATELTNVDKVISHSSEIDLDLTIIDSNNDRDVLSDIYDREDDTGANERYILALVKLKPPKDITFGCILTVVHDKWVLTAASCLEAIKEVDSLDNFIIMEGYGRGDYSKNHAIADVQIHLLYQGVNRSYDLAALKSEDSLVEGESSAVRLPQLLDYFLVTIGERFTVLGYGSFRTIDKSILGNSLRQAYVHKLPAKQCPLCSDTWGLRTLKPDEPMVHAPCGTAPLCAGVLFARGAPCNYCAGTPLMYGPVLYGIMSDNQQCGVSCEPQIYVNIAVVREWLDSLLITNE